MPGSEAGSAEKGGWECDLVIGNTLGNRVETEARVGEKLEGSGTAACSILADIGRLGEGSQRVRMLRKAGAACGAPR